MVLVRRFRRTLRKLHRSPGCQRRRIFGDGRGRRDRTADINGAIFSESRLDTLYVRLSAAYKDVHALLMKSGAMDLLTGERAFS